MNRWPLQGVTSQEKRPQASLLQKSGSRRRGILPGLLYKQLRQLAGTCRWPSGDSAQMETVANEVLTSVPYCKSRDALDKDALQIRSNIRNDVLVVEHCVRDRSGRPRTMETLLAGGFHDQQHHQQWPRVQKAVPATEILLCESCIYLRCSRPWLSVLQFGRNSNGVVPGPTGADFALRDLEQMHELRQEQSHRRQGAEDPRMTCSVSAIPTTKATACALSPLGRDH